MVHTAHRVGRPGNVLHAHRLDGGQRAKEVRADTRSIGTASGAGCLLSFQISGQKEVKQRWERKNRAKN